MWMSFLELKKTESSVFFLKDVPGSSPSLKDFCEPTPKKTNLARKR